ARPAQRRRRPVRREGRGHRQAERRRRRLAAHGAERRRAKAIRLTGARPMNAITLPLPRAVPASPLPRIRGLLLLGALLAVTFVFGFGVWAIFAPLESAAQATGVVEVASSRK